MPEGRGKKGYTHRCVLKVRVRHLAPKSQSPSPLQQYNLTQKSRSSRKNGGAHSEQSHLARNTRYPDTIPRKTRRDAGKKKGAARLASLKDSNFPKAVATSPQLKRTAPKALQESPIQRFLQPRLARSVNQCRKKRRPNAGEVSGGACTYEGFAKGMISAYGLRRGDRTQGATLVADTGKKIA